MGESYRVHLYKQVLKAELKDKSDESLIKSYHTAGKNVRPEIAKELKRRKVPVGILRLHKIKRKPRRRTSYGFGYGGGVLLR